MSNYYEQIKEQVEIILKAIDTMDAIHKAFMNDANSSEYPPEIRYCVRGVDESLNPEYDSWIHQLSGRTTRHRYRTENENFFNWLSKAKKYDEWKNSL